MGDRYTPGAKSSVVHWIWISLKSLFHILHDAVFSRIENKNQVSVNLYLNDMVNKNQPMLLSVHDEESIEESYCERSTVMKILRSWKANNEFNYLIYNISNFIDV